MTMLLIYESVSIPYSHPAIHSLSTSHLRCYESRKVALLFYQRVIDSILYCTLIDISLC